jgi:hypothetical protein
MSAHTTGRWLTLRPWGNRRDLDGHVCWVCGRRCSGLSRNTPCSRCYQCKSRNCHAIICDECMQPEPFDRCPYCKGPVRAVSARPETKR